MSNVFGWILWGVGLFVILLVVWYFWGGRTIATYEIDKEDK